MTVTTSGREMGTVDGAGLLAAGMRRSSAVAACSANCRSRKTAHCKLG
jgi:hypothetical protein